MKFTVKENLVGSISSDGVFEGREQKERPQSSKLGKPSKQSRNKQNDTAKQGKSKLSKKERQRTGNGKVDSTLASTAPDLQDIEVLEAKRGAKSVTIVR